MQDPDVGGARQPAETLQVGPPPLSEKARVTWQRLAVAFLAFLLGVAAGGSAVLWRQARPAPLPPRTDEHAVELLLVDASPSRAHHGAQQSGSSPLQVEGALLLSGGVTSTVLEIGALGGSVEVRAPALPLTVSPTVRFQSVGLSILVRDCNAAIGWATGDRPFTIRWRDEYGEAHLDRAGDFGRSMARSLIRYTDAVCGPRNR